MNDMSSTIVAKSDQINAADLIGTSRTITVREVRIKAGEDQPVAIFIEGDAKAFRPCKGVRRLLVRVWGSDASKYIGQSMTLFCDSKVTWAGKEEGGIRISHMTGLREKIVEYMRVSRAATKPYEILPLKVEQRQQQPDTDAAANWTKRYIGNVEKCADIDELVKLENSQAVRLAELKEKRPELHKQITDASTARGAAVSKEGKPEDQTGEEFTDAGEGAF